jgi:hypothetical protein
MSSLVIDLAPEVLRRLQEEAAKQGQPPAEYARAAVEDRLTDATRQAEARARLQTFFVKAQEHSAAIGGTPEEIEQEVLETCREVRAERYAAPRSADNGGA